MNPFVQRAHVRFGLFVVLTLVGVDCRSVRTVHIRSGPYRISEANAGSELSGVELQVDVEGRRAELRDGKRAIPLALDPLPRKEWREDCGTMSGYASLETMSVTPSKVELRGTSVSLTRLSAACGAGVELHGNLPRRWIFAPISATP